MPHEPFRVHRLALAAANPDAQEASLRSAWQSLLLDFGEERLLAFLAYHGLDVVWGRAMRQGRFDATPGESARLALDKARLVATVRYLGQRGVLQEVDALFTSLDIPYAAYKGAHIRERVYDEPTLRKARDLDVLVREVDRERAARALIGAGFILRVDPRVVSHEASLFRDHSQIDLHWDVLRPGRSRIPLADAFLARRCRVGELSVLDDEDEVVVMLTHGAFVRYVCSSQLLLCRAMDFLVWTRSRPVAWDSVYQRLEAAGLIGAAWAVLAWFDLLGNGITDAVPAGFVDRLRPGALRAAYLRKWVEADLVGYLASWPILIKVGFTLPMHDQLSDALRFLRHWTRARSQAARDPFLDLQRESRLPES